MPSELITVAQAQAHLLRSDSDISVPAFKVYHNGTSSATGCTVLVLSGTTGAVSFTISGGANAGTYTYDFATYSTISGLVTGINDAGRGFIANVEGDGTASPTTLQSFPATSCLLEQNTRVLLRADEETIQNLIYGVSSAIEDICGYTFAATSYTSWLDGRGQPFLSLPNRPVNSVSRVSRRTRQALRITNTGASNTTATVQVTTSGITLYHVSAAGTATTTTIAAATYKTLTTIAAQVTAAGNGWSATVPDSTIASEQSALLRPTPGLDALGVEAVLECADRPEGDYDVDYQAAFLTSGYEFPAGKNNIFVAYNAGYTTIPYSVQQLCAELVAQAYNTMRTGEGIKSGSLGDMSFSRDLPGLQIDTPENRERLGKYIMYRAA